MSESGGRLRRLATESAIYSAGGVATRILAFLLVPIFTRALDPADYGVVGLVAATMSLVSIFAILGLDSAVGRWFWDTDEEPDRKITISTWFAAYLAAGVVAGALVAAASGWLGELLDVPDGERIFRLAALTIPLGVVGVVAANLLRLQRRPATAAVFALVTGVSWLGFAVLFVAVMDRGVPGVFEAQVAGAVVGTVVGLALGRGWVNPRAVRRDRLRAMLRFALPLMPAAIAFWAVNLSDRYFLRWFSGDEAVGLYQVSNALAAAVALLTVGFQQAWGPFALSIHQQEGARDTYSKAFSAYTVGGCVAAAALSVASPELLRLVATPAYLPATDAVPWLAMSYVVLGMTYIAGLGASLVKTTRPVAIAVGLAALANLVLNIALVPDFEGVGAGVATLGGWLVMAAYIFHRSHKLYPIPYRFISSAVLCVVALAISVAGMYWRPEAIGVAILGKTALVFLLVPVALALRMVTWEQLAGVLRGKAS